MNNGTPPFTPTSLLIFIVRFLGLIVLIVGLVIGVKVILEAWHLYKEPTRIERFAQAVEAGSHLDSLLSSLVIKPDTKSVPRAPRRLEDPPLKTAKAKVSLTYLISWGIVLVLLMVIGSLACTAIKVGGQLALYDLQVKHFAQQLFKEARKPLQKQ